jgi:hypothetical protein
MSTIPSERPDERAVPALFHLSEDDLALMQRFGATLRDAIRAVRPGGPLDDSEFLTHCCKCGIDRAETLRWFCDRGFTCECGGKFDTRLLHAFHEAAANYISALRATRPLDAFHLSLANREKRKADALFHRIYRPIEIENVKD